MTKYDLEERLLVFAVGVIAIVEALPSTIAGKRIGDQLLRAGTAVGANYSEAQAAESPADFLHKLQIALKEMREAYYWLRLLDRSALLPAERLTPLLDESLQLRAILSKAVVTAKSNRRPRPQPSLILPCRLPFSVIFAFCLLPFTF